MLDRNLRSPFADADIAAENPRMTILLYLKSTLPRPHPGKMLFLLLLAISACRNASPPPERAFYCWQTSLRLSAEQRFFLDSLSCKKLYVKVLDVGKDPASGNIEPLARLEMSDSTGLDGRELVPVVFMTNEVFQKLSPEKVEWLAEKVGHWKVGYGHAAEWQIDCDWTAGSRQAYFSFLENLKRQLPPGCRLSATVRLHQFKFPDETGVPPVDRGMLMLYNTGDLEHWQAGNSIFSTTDAGKYLSKGQHYPLPLDLALPGFSWTLAYREGTLWKIITGLAPGEMARDTAFFTALAPIAENGVGERGCTRFAVRKGTFRQGYYLRPGDLLRCETVPPDLLKEAATLAGKLDWEEGHTLALFALDSAMIRAYPLQLLDSVWKDFGK